MASANFTNLTRALAKADIDFDTATFKGDASLGCAF